GEGEKEDVRRRYGIAGDYILALSDIHPRKNLEGLVEAFGRAKAEAGIPHKLVIVGAPLWKYPEFYRKCDSSRFRSDIVLTGYVPAADVKPLYQGASMF